MVEGVTLGRQIGMMMVRVCMINDRRFSLSALTIILHLYIHAHHHPFTSRSQHTHLQFILSQSRFPSSEHPSSTSPITRQEMDTHITSSFSFHSTLR